MLRRINIHILHHAFEARDKTILTNNLTDVAHAFDLKPHAQTAAYGRFGKGFVGGISANSGLASIFHTQRSLKGTIGGEVKGASGWTARQVRMRHIQWNLKTVRPMIIRGDPPLLLLESNLDLSVKDD